jgi:hypothetical protein
MQNYIVQDTNSPDMSCLCGKDAHLCAVQGESPGLQHLTPETPQTHFKCIMVRMIDRRTGDYVYHMCEDPECRRTCRGPQGRRRPGH